MQLKYKARSSNDVSDWLNQGVQNNAAQIQNKSLHWCHWSMKLKQIGGFGDENWSNWSNLKATTLTLCEKKFDNFPMFSYMKTVRRCDGQKLKKFPPPSLIR